MSLSPWERKTWLLTCNQKVSFTVFEGILTYNGTLNSTCTQLRQVLVTAQSTRYTDSALLCTRQILLLDTSHMLQNQPAGRTCREMHIMRSSKKLDGKKMCTAGLVMCTGGLVMCTAGLLQVNTSTPTSNSENCIKNFELLSLRFFHSTHEFI